MTTQHGYDNGREPSPQEKRAKSLINTRRRRLIEKVRERGVYHFTEREIESIVRALIHSQDCGR